MRKTIARRLVEAKADDPAFLFVARLPISTRCSGCARRSMRPRRRTRTASLPTRSRSMISSSRPWRSPSCACRRPMRPGPKAPCSSTSTPMSASRSRSPAALITPIVRKAQSKTLSVISNEMKDFAQRAKARKLKPQEYRGRHDGRVEPRHVRRDEFLRGDQSAARHDPRRWRRREARRRRARRPRGRDA